jgi:ankyrin repeat protein/gamma-glutamyl-gamma-aminobutyrate hydrolase PuuD
MLNQLLQKTLTYIDNNSITSNIASYFSKLLIYIGADINAKDKDGLTPLLKALDKGEENHAIELIRLGADITATSPKGHTALHYAAMRNEIKAAELLIENGSKINVLNEYNYNPLREAVEKGYTEFVKLLIKNGADSNIHDESHKTPIMIAIEKGYNEITIELIKQGADVNAKDLNGTTSLFYAIDHDDINAIKLLLEYGADSNIKNTENNSPISYAIKSNKNEALKILLDDPNVRMDERNSYGNTLLHIASFSDNIEAFKLLVASGAEIDAANIYGQPPLLYTAFYGQLEAVQLLIKHGANVNSKDNYSQPPIYFAVQQGHIDVVGLLINNGANMNAVIFSGDNLLLHALEYEHFDIIKLLLDCGITIPDDKIELPIFYAVQTNNVDLINYLLNKEFPVTEKAIIEAAGRNHEILTLLSEHTNFNIPDEALIKAVKNGRTENIYYLLDKGLMPTSHTLYYAEKYKNHDLVTSFVEKYDLKPDYDLYFQLALKEKSTDEVENYIMQGAKIKAPIIGISNIYGEWSGPVLSVAEDVMEKEGNIYFLPISNKHVANEEFVKQFSGFINPGATDSFPRNQEFQLKDLDKAKMLEKEHLYQAVLEISNKYHIPYLGICSGSQHLILNHEGYLNLAPGYIGGDHQAQFIYGTLPYFMALDETEQELAINECIMPEVTFPIWTAHNFAGVKEKLGSVKLGATSEAGVVEAFSYGGYQLGFQFHPEQYYFYNYDEIGLNRQKFLLDHFFGLSRTYNEAMNYAESHNISHEEMVLRLKEAEELLLSKLEACSHKAISPAPKHSYLLENEICLDNSFQKEFIKTIEKSDF